MTMHLEGPWLSTTGKQKGKKKWASSEAKRKAEQLEVEWKAKLKAWGVEAEDKKRKRALSSEVMTSFSPSTPPGRETTRIASQDTGWVTCSKISDPVYTGNSVVGISTLHKSNGVPVFSKQEATDISKMRR